MPARFERAVPLIKAANSPLIGGSDAGQLRYDTIIRLAKEAAAKERLRQFR